MNTKNVRSVLAALLASACAVASVAQAAPAVTGVSGTLGAGESVTLVGGGFGTKPQAAPLLWDDFELGTAGQPVQGARAQIGSWDTGAGSENVSYATGNARTGTKSAYHNFVDFYNASLAKNGTFTRVYMDFWMRVAPLGGISRNFKPWRFYGPNDSLQLAYVWLCNGQLMTRDQGSAGWSIGSWGGPELVMNQWMHFQLVYQQSSPNTANGTIRHLIDSKVAGIDSNAVITQVAADSFDQIRIGHYWSQEAVDTCAANPGARIYVDDVYLDTSWARVEIGNASTYAASTQREIQVATAWSDGSITIKFNPGKFAAGATAYLYVTDANNVTSPGLPIRIGGQSTPPSPPSAVSAR